MREIKFRGTTPKGEVVCGDLTHCNGHVFVDDKRVVTFDQFAGYDENGEELYEGDTVIFEGKYYKISYCFCGGVFKNLKRCRNK